MGWGLAPAEDSPLDARRGSASNSACRAGCQDLAKLGRSDAKTAEARRRLEDHDAVLDAAFAAYEELRVASAHRAVEALLGTLRALVGLES